MILSYEMITNVRSYIYKTYHFLVIIFRIVNSEKIISLFLIVDQVTN